MATTDESFYTWGNKEPLNATNLTKRFVELARRLEPLEAIDLSYQALVGEVNDTVLAQAEATIASLRAQLQQITLLQWLTGVSGTPITMTVGDAALIIVESDRVLFTPGPFSVLSRISDPNTYAILQSQSYDRTSGQYNFEILTVAGPAGTYSDWSVSAVAGSTLAQMTLLAQGNALRDASAAAAVAAAADRVQTDADAAATAADRAAVHGDRTAADASAAAAAGSALQAAASAATVDTTSYVRKDGSTPYTGVQRGVAPPANDSTAALVTSAWVQALVAALVNGSPAVLDTLKELADAIGDDPNFATTISTALASRLRFDAPQALGPGPQSVARRNIGTLSRGRAVALASF